MVERAICSTGEETNTSRSLKSPSCRIETSLDRNDDFRSTENDTRREELENSEILTVPEVEKIVEGTRSNETSRESAIGGVATGTGRFSLFKWFKRGSRESASSSSSSLCDRRERRKRSNKEEKGRREAEELNEDEIASELSSNDSVETLYSTATVRSFAFCTGTLRDNEDATRRDFSTSPSSDIVKNATRQVGPFGSGAAKIATRFNANDTDVTKTLPANVLSKRRDITARYSLQPCNGNTGGFVSCGNIAIQRDNLGGTLRRHEGRGGRVHVRGKRRAPNPPVNATKSKNIDGEAKISKNTGRRKRRPAPKPPDTNIARLKVTTSSATRRDETEGVILVGKKETESGNLASNGERESTIFCEKRETECESLTTKGKSESGNFSTKGESATLSEKEETGSVVLPEKKLSESEKGAKVVEAKGEEENNEVSRKANTGISIVDGLVSDPIVSKNNRTTSENIWETVRASTVPSEINSCPSNEREHDRASREGVNSGNSDLFSSRKTVGDVTNFNTGTLVDTSGTNVSSTSETLELPGSISNDSLVLQGGVLHSKREIISSTTSSSSSISANDLERTLGTSKGRFPVTTGSQTSASAMPRPWYKRSVFEHSRDSGTSRRAGDVLRNPTQPEGHEERVGGPSVSGSSSSKSRQGEKNHEGGTLSRLNFFHRGEKNNDERKKENKRKSGLSILTNISELDKEAAAIVQEEQARARAASMILQASRSSEQTTRNEETEDVVQNMVTSAMESSPRRGTRALISKFNAIGNITKVTVNTSFLTKNAYPRDATVAKNDATKNSSDDSSECRDRKTFSKSENVRVDKDLSRYFLPAQRQTTCNKTIENIAEIPKDTSGPKKNNSDISARLSFFQGFVGNERDDSGDRETSLQAKISRLNEEVLVRDAGKSSQETSPKVAKLRVNILESISHPEKFNCQGFNEKPRKTVVKEETSKEMHMEKKDRDIIRKDFSSIFNEIERQSTSRDLENRATKAKKFETSSSTSQVSKVLDLLVEAEKNDKQKTNLSRYSRGNENLENFEKHNDSSTSPLENPARTDLKEMLKEMKHSLPKRSKAKKLSSQQSSLKTEGDGSTEGEKKELNLSEDKQKDAILLGDKKNIISHLLSPVTVAYPPPIRIGPPAVDRVEKTIFRANEEREYDKQKVSSAAQTSGNVRKINRQGQGKTDDQARSLGQATSSKWKNEDIVYKTSGKGVGIPGTSGLTKNTFQLIRPREFAQIEAIKTMKNSRAENTYANVIEHSLYANAVVPATKTSSPQISRIEETREKRIDLVDDQKSRIHDREITESGIMAQDTKVVDQQNMNTLAVNRLLRKLEAAIASGHHQQAAGLAKELARLKIHCSVVRQRTKIKDIVNVNMYIEDKLAHQGPIPLRLARSMTVGQLKAKVFTEFEIPANVQRWIVGQRLADDDATTLESLQTVEGSPIFLYLVAPELKNGDSALTVEKVPSTEQETPRDPDPEPVEGIMNLDQVEEPDEEPAEKSPESRIVKDEDDEECISEEVRMERYEALISLENCDVIPNSEPIECPICFVTYGPQEGVILRDCLHMFCRPCIANTIRYCEEAEVRCPYRDTEYTCESTLQEREIKALVEPEVYQRHLAKSIAQAENNAGNNAFHCKTPDCPGWCIYDDNVNNFLCPVCAVSNCLTCQVVHTGMNCREYQKALRLSKETDQESKRTAAMLEEMVDRGEALPCPTCAVVLMKKWGCDWLRCSMCKTEICWVTRGPRWGPGGKGDTSGGCRCGEKGVKCHPRCNYCH